jgi:hypothetical protein
MQEKKALIREISKRYQQAEKKDAGNNAARRIVDTARFGVRYTYTIKEACGILAVFRNA